MAGSVRKKIEGIVYAGLKPDAARTQSRLRRWLSSLGKRIERSAGGRAPSDPLYLTNRTAAQKFKAAMWFVLPGIILGGAIVVAWVNLEMPRTPPPAPQTAQAEAAAKALANVENSIQVEKIARPQDVDVVEVHVERVPVNRLVGTLHNRTGRSFQSVDVVFEMTDSQGSQLGAVRAEVTGVPARGTVEFHLPIVQKRAAYALVREIHTR